MNSTFGILFSIGISHSYYSGKCEDFDFIMPSDSASMARNGRIITRVIDGKFYALGNSKILTEQQVLKDAADSFIRLLHPEVDNPEALLAFRPRSWVRQGRLTVV